jgi:tRNA G46 methylase TrmB
MILEHRSLPIDTPLNVTRLDWDLKRRQEVAKFDQYWHQKKIQVIRPDIFESVKEVWLEVGAGSGAFFLEMARRNPQAFLIAIERSRDRGNRLVRKANKSGLPNLAGYRGNAIPALVTGIPSNSLSRIYIMYPCPWVKTSQRKNRWYLHPIMPHLLRILKPGGRIIWTSDQKFYIDEARFVSESRYQMKVLVHGEITPNPYNDLASFPGGRTKFERSFLASGLPCFEVVVEKTKSEAAPVVTHV